MLQTHNVEPCAGLDEVKNRDIIVPKAFLGVGAPEAILVGVVALVLFGPKGLAEAAKGLGQAVKAFAPTIRELTDISTDLKSTLEEEIGLNDLKQELQSTISPVIDSTSNLRSTASIIESRDVSADDPDIESKRLESAKAAWGQDDIATSDLVVEPSSPSLETLSLEELEAEIAKRKNGSLDA